MKKILLIGFLLVLLLVVGCLDQKKKVGEDCTKNGDCSSGNCTNFYCKASNIGEYCGNTSDCTAGTCSNNYCTLINAKGTCTQDADCSTGSCYTGKCFKKDDALCELNKAANPYWFWISLTGLLVLVIGIWFNTGGASKIEVNPSSGWFSIAGPLLIGVGLMILGIMFLVFAFC